MESQLLELRPHLWFRRDVELQPNPSTDDFGLIPEFGHLVFQSSKQRQRVRQACLFLIHSYSLSAVHLCQQVASGLVTLAGSADGVLAARDYSLNLNKGLSWDRGLKGQ